MPLKLFSIRSFLLFLFLPALVFFIRPPVSQGDHLSAAAPLNYQSELAGMDLTTGKKFSLDQDNKKGIVLIFLSTKCPCSASHLNHLEDLKGKFPEFIFLGIHSNQDEPENSAKVFFQEKHLGFPV